MSLSTRTNTYEVTTTGVSSKWRKGTGGKGRIGAGRGHVEEGHDIIHPSRRGGRHVRRLVAAAGVVIVVGARTAIVVAVMITVAIVLVIVVAVDVIGGCGLWGDEYQGGKMKHILTIEVLKEVENGGNRWSRRGRRRKGDDRGSCEVKQNRIKKGWSGSLDYSRRFGNRCPANINIASGK